MPRGGQLVRQWRLLQLVDRPSGVSADEAAASLGCAVRTIWRDRRVLEDAGFPIYDERAEDSPRTIWRFAPDFRRRLPLKLTLTEIAVLVMSRELLAPYGLGQLGPDLASALDKITGVLSKDALALLDRIRETIGVRMFGAKLQLPAADFVPRLQQALVERRRLRMAYHSLARGEITHRIVDPYHLEYYNGGLYVVGYCHLRDDVRIFAVERIRELAVEAKRFEPPAGFDARKYLENALGILRGELVTVRIVFAKALAPYIRERSWHPTQKLRDLPDGRLEMTMRVADTLEVRRWILGYGAQAEVVEPASLREAIRGEAEAVAALLIPGRRPLALTRSARPGRGAAPSRRAGR